MAYFTDSLFERMMVSAPDASDGPRKRGRREMLKEYEACNSRETIGGDGSGRSDRSQKPPGRVHGGE